MSPPTQQSDEQPPGGGDPDIISDPNPNSTSRPSRPDGIILHSMGEYITYEGAELFAADFLNEIGLSAHYLIEPGGQIIECVEPARQAYHAGKSRFNGQENLNSTFIGIELLIAGLHDYGSFLQAIKDPDSFTAGHYDSAEWLCRKLMSDYDIPASRLVRHSDVSGVEVRPDSPKHDPGAGFDYDGFIDRLA